MKTAIIVGILIGGWDLAWYLMGVKPLFPWQLKKQLHTPRRPLRLIDVRTPGEFARFQIPGAENHPGLLFGRSAGLEGQPDKPLVIICMTGHRSPIVAWRLKKRGYKNVYNLIWGMLGWQLCGGMLKKLKPGP